jgi:hypothetical protein
VIPLSPEEQERRRPPPPVDLLGASWEPIATPERKLMKCRLIRLPKRSGAEPRAGRRRRMNPFRLVANNERPSVDRLRLRLETERRLMDDPAELSALQTQLLVVLDRVDRGLEELCRLAAEDEA